MPLPTLNSLLAAAVVNSKDVPSLQQIPIFSLEDCLGYRPDWDRLPEELEDELTSIIDFRHIISKNNISVIFPYYSSIPLCEIAENMGLLVIGNNGKLVEMLYSREFGRNIFHKLGLLDAGTIVFRSLSNEMYEHIATTLASDKLVIAPHYSDGGGWIYFVNSKYKFSQAATEIENAFPSSSYIEVAPYHEGLPCNLTICVLPSQKSSATIVVYPPSVQIIGDPQLSDQQLRYCGCDFSLAQDVFSNKDMANLVGIATRLGRYLFDEFNWRGLLGVDFILKPNGEMVFLEINPRIQSSTHLIDLTFHDNEWNPFLLQLKSFLSLHPSEETIDLTLLCIDKSMITMHNTAKEKISRIDDRIPGDLGEYGLPNVGHSVDPGGVLFRKNYSGSILDKNNRQQIISPVRKDIDSIFQRYFKDDAKKFLGAAKISANHRRCAA